MLMARIDSADVFQDQKAEFPSGYILRITPSGRWELLSATYKSPTLTLASGSLILNAAAWHHLTLSTRGRSITATCDGRSLASVRDSSHAHGMFGIGSGWNHVQFYNLRVTPEQAR